jgi:hypothetical protein
MTESNSVLRRKKEPGCFNSTTTADLTASTCSVQQWDGQHRMKPSHRKNQLRSIIYALSVLTCIAVHILSAGDTQESPNVSTDTSFTYPQKARPKRYLHGCNIEIPEHSLHDGKGITWIGDNWIPPKGSRMYTAIEMQRFFQTHSILWIGDSTIRRAYATLYPILNHNFTAHEDIDNDLVDDEKVIDINKGEKTEICDKWTNHSVLDHNGNALCRPMPHTLGTKRFDFLSARCMNEVIRILDYILEVDTNLVKNYTVVVVSTGTWDMSPHKRKLCLGRGFPEMFLKYTNETFLRLEKLQSPELSIIWRTPALNQHNLEGDFLTAYNKQCLNWIRNFEEKNMHSNFSSIDFATAIHPRTLFYERIAGNNIYHFGLNGRLLFLQMLMNHLVLQQAEWTNVR